MVGGISNISIPNLSYSVVNFGKMSIPVDSSSLVYSQFEHVSGVPAPDGTQGISISKLNLLDVLIGQLSRIRQSAPAQPQVQSTVNPYEGVDALIEKLSSQIQQAKSASEVMPYNLSPNAGTGVLFSLFS